VKPAEIYANTKPSLPAILTRSGRESAFIFCMTSLAQR